MLVRLRAGVCEVLVGLGQVAYGMGQGKICLPGFAAIARSVHASQHVGKNYCHSTV